MTNQTKTSRRDAATVGSTDLSAASIGTGPIAEHAAAFLNGMVRDGYEKASIHRYRRAFERLDELLRTRAIPLAELTPDAAVGLIETGWRQPSKDGMPYAVRQLITELQDRGVTAAERPTHYEIARRETMAAFADFLRRERGCREPSIVGMTYVAEDFLRHRFGRDGDRIDELTHADVTDYFLDYAKRQPSYRDKTRPSHLRAFLIFLFRTARTDRNLSLAVPKVAARKHASIPRYINADDIEKVVAAPLGHLKTPLRTRALVLLMARLGLRAREVRSLLLGDIDWHAGEIVVRGKGDFHDRLPLLADVGEALAAYIMHERQGPERTVFVSSKPPFAVLIDDGMVNETIRHAFKAAGVARPSKHVGSHVFRHSLATAMVAKGSSLEEVGDVLRHRSHGSTMIYAKVDIEGLRSIARGWPAARPTRVEKEGVDEAKPEEGGQEWQPAIVAEHGEASR